MREPIRTGVRASVWACTRKRCRAVVLLPAAEVRSISCKAPDFVPVIYTLDSVDGGDPMTVIAIACTFVGTET